CFLDLGPLGGQSRLSPSLNLDRCATHRLPLFFALLGRGDIDVLDVIQVVVHCVVRVLVLVEFTREFQFSLAFTVLVAVVVVVSLFSCRRDRGERGLDGGPRVFAVIESVSLGRVRGSVGGLRLASPSGPTPWLGLRHRDFRNWLAVY